MKWNEQWLSVTSAVSKAAPSSGARFLAEGVLWELHICLLSWTLACFSHTAEIPGTLRCGWLWRERNLKPFSPSSSVHMQDALDHGWLTISFPTRCCRRNQTYWKCPAGRGERRREQGGPRKCLNIKKLLPIAPPSLPLSSILPSHPNLDFPPSCSHLWACLSLSHYHLNPFSLCVANI